MINPITLPIIINLIENTPLKENLILTLEKRGLQQEDLFTQDISLETITEEIFSLFKEKKSLYQRWTQTIRERERLLSIPHKSLKKFMNYYLLEFIKKGDIHKKCHGGEEGYSVRKSLETHLPFTNTLSFDLKSAFENASLKYVYKFFYENINFNILETEKEELATFLSIICTIKYQNGRGLPQGSSHSMSIFNRILYNLDDSLNKKAEEKGLIYTRWVDDITISSKEDVPIEEFLGAVKLTEEIFPVSEKKTYFQRGENTFLLGHKIINGKIIKNTKRERLENKTPPLDYDQWFNDKEIKYSQW